MDTFPGNSHAAKATPEPPREKLQPVTSAKALPRKRGLGHKLKETFVGGDARSAADHVIFGIVIPGAKDMLFEAFQSGVERLIYGEEIRPRRGASAWAAQNTARIDYAGISRPTRASAAQQPHSLSRRARARHDFGELIIPSRQEAEDVISRMYDMLSQYGHVSVADLYELTGIRSDHTDMKWGWVNLRGARAVRQRTGGFLLELPEPVAFD